MKPETFFDNFEMLAEAPNGVKVLRELILQLAVRGKLVAQDERDEPAAVLIGKIKAERERLIKEKKIRKGIVLPSINLNEIPFLIPNSWVFIRLNDIGDWGSGSTPDRKNNDFYGGKILWFKSGELNDGYVKESEEKITELALEKCSLRKNNPEDVLFAMYGATVGKLAILEVEATTNQAVCACTCHTGFYNRYLFYLLMAYKNRFINESAGAAQPNFSKDKIIQTIAPLPPLPEQHRIVAKVDQLMSFCDELEARQQKKRESRALINSAALDRLLTARAPGEFAQGWRRISDNFDLLYDAPENVGALRKAILRLAIMGKLFEQDANDEPASVLFEKIKAKKERLIKEKKIKKSDISSVEPNELSNTLPRGWILSNINEISLLVTDGEHQTPPRISNSEIPLGTAKNVRDGYLDLENTDYVSMETAVKCWKRCEPMHNDILMVCVGATTGRLCLLKKPPKFVIVRSVALVRPFPDYIYPEYLATVMKSPIVQSQVWKNVKQSAQPCLYINRINVINIPIPPLAEQHRIVARVDQLMSLCDDLEAGLLRSQADSEKLIEVVVGRMLAGGDRGHGAE